MPKSSIYPKLFLAKTSFLAKIGSTAWHGSSNEMGNQSLNCVQNVKRSTTTKGPATGHLLRHRRRRVHQGLFQRRRQQGRRKGVSSHPVGGGNQLLRGRVLQVRAKKWTPGCMNSPRGLVHLTVHLAFFTARWRKPSRSSNHFYGKHHLLLLKSFGEKIQMP